MSDTKTKAKAAEAEPTTDTGELGDRPYEGVKSEPGAEQHLTTDEELGGYPAYAGEGQAPVAPHPTPEETPGTPEHLEIDPANPDPVYGGAPYPYDPDVVPQTKGK